MSENRNLVSDPITIKTKNPRRVAAGKKGAEAKKMKADLKRKETEAMKKELQSKEQSSKSELQITKDEGEDSNTKYDNNEVKYKNYIPLYCLIGVVGIGLYMYKSKQVSQTVTPVQQQTVLPVQQNKSECIDKFAF